MQIQTRPLSDLKPAPYNPRRPLTKGSVGYEKLARSLREFELVQPIVWNQRSGCIVSGHQRVQILRDAGQTHVEVVVVDLPPEREKALNLALNNAQVGSDWDPSKLTELVGELQSLPDFDATLTGFNADDLRALCFLPVTLNTADTGTRDEPSATQHVIHWSIEIPPDQWDELRPLLDELIATYRLRVHVRLPSAPASAKSTRSLVVL